MAEVLGVASSIAGLVSLADTVVRLGYKYIKDVKDAEKSVQNLVKEVNNLSGVLHSLENMVQALEAQDTSQDKAYIFLSKNPGENVRPTAESYTGSEVNISEVEVAIQEGGNFRVVGRDSKSQTYHEFSFKHSANVTHIVQIFVFCLTDLHRSTLIEILASQEQLIKDVTAMNDKIEAARIERQRLAASTVDVMKWQNSNIRLRQPGTGVWFTESKDFKDWTSTDNSNLWIHGIPGAGKTILMASVIREIEQTQDPSHGLAMFYCDYKDTQTHDPRTILETLARQLILQHEHAFMQLEAFCEKHHMTESTQGSATTDDLCEFVVELSRNFSTTSIVVDGLDEIAEDRAEVTRLLKSLNKPSGTIKTLLASRNEVDIRIVLEDYPCVSIAAKSGDLRLYVHSEIEKRTKLGKLRIRDHNLKDHIVKVLTEGADGMFRWVACQMDYLCECSTDRDRREALRKLPPDLPKSYERILDRVNRSSKENQTIVRHTLLWVVYAEKPLTITQLLQALAVRPGDETFEKENMTTLDELLNWCSSLVRQKSQSDELELAHFTVKEYLLSLSEECGPGLSQYRLSGDHAELVRVCCDFLSLSEFDGTLLPVTKSDSEPTDFNKAWKEFEENYSFMRYVLCFWPMHVHQSAWSEISNEVLLLFDETRSCYRLWTFGYYHHRMLSFCYYTDFLKSDDLLPADHLNCVMGSSRPSALHWAAMIALPDICTAFINRGADLNAPSIVGSPLQCAILHDHAIYEDFYLVNGRPLEYSENQRWWSGKVIEYLIMAGAALDKIDIIELLYRHSGSFAYYDSESDTELFRVIFDKNPIFSVESLSAFLQYTFIERCTTDSYRKEKTRYNNASLPIEFLKWGARTNFAHFAPDTLPLFLAVIHDDLAFSDYSLSSLQFFIDIDFLGISRNYRMETNSNSSEHTQRCITKMSTLMLEFIQNSCVNPSSYLAKIVSEVFTSTNAVQDRTVFEFIFRLWDNNIMLDFNWRNKVGNTVLHEFFESVGIYYDWEIAHPFILKAVLECRADLTISNNLNITPIELLIPRATSDTEEMLSFFKIWRAGDISGACEKNPSLLKRLLDAANSVDQVECILGQLAKDLKKNTNFLQDVLARHCTEDYIKELFSLQCKYGLQTKHILALEKEDSYQGSSDEEGSYDRSSVVGEHEAYTTIDEEENGDDGTSRDGLTRRGKSSITKDIRGSFTFLEKAQDSDLPTAVESFEYACSVAKTENVPTNKTLAESGGPLAIDEKTHSHLHLLSSSHDSADFGKFRLLLANKPDLEIRNHQNFTPLAIAIRSKNLRAMYALLISHANIEAHLSHRQTYLHLACCLGNEEAVWALLYAGADTSHKDDHGNTAEDLAAIIGRSDIVDLFSGRGNDDSCAETHYSESSANESLDEDLSNGEEPDISDSRQLPPLSIPQDLAYRLKSSQSTSTLEE
ncbi:hypothetical protein BOTNAR_0010g00270 [Botryotinia narcissicola]|uniref:NACHT domain-containing protein n=1 Tax=Botryotinia narcissicola TaxID=278944 RepID=A0A4Z1J7H4_9HELO|nr:hypothetical protein BOTNAR_0010g00270 [Botryotinia narcissicola]